ncbi:AIM24 family protein [Actinoalloteichus caeruleus]|uniref:AIM24 family protein n=1 Tax=Actinoalloteichus cyanogriseus TaxID=2893586 RepID=UPI0004AB208E|nr:AIM24 family protein [Actinoalloteichus caeruleus]
MQVVTRHTPGYGVARLVLGGGEQALAEVGTMMATSFGVAVESRRVATGRGPGRGLRGGGTQATGFTAPPPGGWVDVAPNQAGDLYIVELDGRSGWCVRARSWLAVAGTVVFDRDWPGLRSLLGSDEGFLTHAGGHGPLVLSCHGSLDVVNLKAGEVITLSAGHVLGYRDDTRVRLRALDQLGEQSVRTGAGLLLDVVGPARVLTQTRVARTVRT